MLYGQMNRLVKIGKAADILGVTVQTLRKWEKSGKLLPDRKTDGGTRYYDLSRIVGRDSKSKSHDLTIGYARVSSHDQRKDLDRQKELLEMFCASNGWQHEIISDLGSGLNYRKKGLKELIRLIDSGKMSRLVVTHKDRLLRFGAELIFTLCEMRQIEVVIINKGEQPSFEEELAKDVLEIITVFSARLYGSRSHKNKQLLKALEQVAKQS
jgi:predicted site-specific integrase-resolvase